MTCSGFALLLLCPLLAAWAQTPPQPAFDAASVKPAIPGGRGPLGRANITEPGRVRYPGTTVQALLLIAYDVQGFQIVGPDWLRTERYDVEATMASATRPEQFHRMLQNLLAERFQLAAHRETRELSGYSLTVSRGGPKFKASAPVADTAADQSDAPLKPPGPDGYFVPPDRPGIFFQLTASGPGAPSGARSTFRQQTMQDLARSLQGLLRRPVVDGTGLTGPYDFALTCAVEGLDTGTGRIPVSGGSGETPPDLFSAVSSQLGLQLVKTTARTEMLIVDRAEKTPTGN